MAAKLLEILLVVEEPCTLSTSLLGVLIAVAMEVVGEDGRPAEEHAHRSAAPGTNH